MRQILFLAASLLSCSVFCQTYITNVTIFDVEKQKTLPAQTVVINGTTISAVGPSAKIKTVAGATVIDGTGKYLLPGLVDAHVHFFQSGGLYSRPDAIDLRKYMPYDKEIDWVHNNMEDFLRRYLQNGITSVIDVGSNPHFLQQRDSFVAKPYAPSVYMTGPLITTYEPAAFKNLKDEGPFYLVNTAEEARQMVQKELAHKPDFIKIWYIAAIGNNVEATARKYLPIVQAAIDEAHKNNLRVAVHATERITAQLAVEAGCDFLVHGVDDEPVSDAFVKLLQSKKVVLSPTLVVASHYVQTFAQENKFSYTDFTKSNPYQLGSLQDLRHIADTQLAGRYRQLGKTRIPFYQKEDSLRMANLKKMVDGGVTIASGTDAGNIGTLHATSFWEELKAMQQAGMTNWQIITASTINGAKAVGKEKEWGSISVGKKADLVLLDANPLDNIGNLQRLQLVVNKGQLVRPDTLIKETPLALVQRQLNAYNARDLEAFLEPYADDVELYTFPNKLISKGKEEMRKTYAFFSRVPNLHCEITERIIQGNTIIDHESVSGFGPKAVGGTAIYQIEGNKIKKVYFVE
jgi:imidazolonepropionase-like amidohydrolase